MALKRSCIAQTEITRKLDVYKGQAAQVQAQEMKYREAHLARALSPQITDVAVSLWWDKLHLLYCCKQGGQIADQFRLSGVEAKNFSKALTDSFNSMIHVIATVAARIGELW